MKKLINIALLLITHSVYMYSIHAMSMTSPVTPQQPINFMPTPTPPTMQGQPANEPQELTQINQIVDAIQNAKKTLKDQLQQLEDKLNEARNEVFTMRKNSADILAKAQEADAQLLLNNVNAGLSKVTAIQTFISNFV